MDFTQSLINTETITTEDQSIKERIFHYCYYLNRDHKLNFQMTSIFYILETVQLVSYAFSYPLQTIWKIPEKREKNIHKILTITRISSLFELLDFKTYLIIWITLLILLFSIFLLFGLSLQINTKRNMFYRFNIKLAKIAFNSLSQFFLIPIFETILLMLRCDENNYVELKNGIKCYKGIHILYSVLSIIFTIIYLIFCIILELFNYSPFNNDDDKNLIKINNSSENFLSVMKLIIVFCYIFKFNDWLCIIILIFTFTINLISCHEYATFNNDCLEIIISIRNGAVLWSYFSCVLAKISSSSKYIVNLLIN